MDLRGDPTMPHSRAGKWSLILTAVAAGDDHPRRGERDRAAGAGLYAIVRDRERAIAVFVGTTFGLLVLAYTNAEVASPH